MPIQPKIKLIKMPTAVVFLTLLLCSCLLSIRLSSCTRITVVNYCKETIWPGITPAIDNATVSGGFQLKPTESNVFSAPSSWHGRIWARTACNFDHSSNATCQTGDCGPALVCSHPGHPPASIAEFALGSDVDYYDVSLVDGFNLPLVVTPVGDGKRGRCSPAGCYDDLRPGCPAELAARTEGGRKTVACRSACDVFGRDEYCCRGEYATPVACLPTNYSRVFKAGCPAAYSFAYDDPTSIVTCSAADYIVAFCPSRNQTQCTYHDNRLVCSGAAAVAAAAGFRLWTVLLITASFRAGAILGLGAFKL